jgi:plastocyanin
VIVSDQNPIELESVLVPGLQPAISCPLKNGPTPPTPEPPPEPLPEPTNGPTTGAAPVPTSVITISGFAFDPSTLEVQPGDTITIVNGDTADHTFTADDGSFDEEVAAGDATEVTLKGSSGDKLAFHCEIHQSMTGTLTFG